VVADAPAVTDTVEDPAVAFTKYPDRAFPPLDNGADHDTTSDVSRPNTAVISGAPGASAGSGANGLDAALQDPLPAALPPSTRATYATPVHKPLTTAAESLAGTETAAGELHPAGGVVPGAGITSAEYVVTAAAAGSGLHATSTPKPCGDTDSRNGAGGTDAASKVVWPATARDGTLGTFCWAAAADAVPALTTATIAHPDKTAVSRAAPPRRIGSPSHPRAKPATASHLKQASTWANAILREPA
jgi:hypothetical protein